MNNERPGTGRSNMVSIAAITFSPGLAAR